MRAIVLLSGGLDSVTVLADALATGYECFALTIDYGQRHGAELAAASALAEKYAAREHRVVRIDYGQFGGSSLTDATQAVPTTANEGIPSTYVPARNTVMLAIALGWAEVVGAQHIFIGVNAVDYSGYPDCRPEFIDAFRALAGVATKSAVEGQPLDIHAPLINMTKGEIIRMGCSLGVDYAQTVSCYQADAEGRACGLCDACRLRKEGFRQAEIEDPTRYG